MGQYFNVGKQVLYLDDTQQVPEIHIADAGDNEKADAIVQAFNGRSQNFIKDALRTCSPNFYGEKVSRQVLVRAMNEAIDALNWLDKVKKTLFYGRDNNLAPNPGLQDVSDLPDRVGADSGISFDVAVDLIHGIIGKATEAGELLEALRNAYNGNGFDMVNLVEEIGDGFWYDAILLNQADATFEETQELIIKKLRARFPDKYADASANERDLAAERAILEDRANPLSLSEELDIEHYSAIDIDEFADGDIEPSKPLLAPTEPASGPVAVTAAADSAKEAFNKIANVQANVGKYEQPLTANPELAKPINERMRPMPQEGSAQANARGIPEKNDGE